MRTRCPGSAMQSGPPSPKGQHSDVRKLSFAAHDHHSDSTSRTSRRESPEHGQAKHAASPARVLSQVRTPHSCVVVHPASRTSVIPQP